MDAVEDEQLVDALAKSWKTGKRGIGGLLKAEREAYLASQGRLPRNRPQGPPRRRRPQQRNASSAKRNCGLPSRSWRSTRSCSTACCCTPRRLASSAKSRPIAVFLVSASRLLHGRALCLLRRGAPASGKNFVTDVITKLVPSEAIIHLNRGRRRHSNIMAARTRTPSSAKSSMSPRPPAWHGVMATSRKPSPCFAR